MAEKLQSQFCSMEPSMKRHNLVSLAVIASTFLAAAPAIYAAPVSIASPVHAMFKKSGTVTFSLRNDTDKEIQVSVGDNVMTLAPGKPISLNLPVGTKILSKSDTPSHPAGTVIAQVISDYNGATIGIK
jgi:hypothetical protein